MGELPRRPSWKNQNRLLALLTGLLVCIVTTKIVLNYGDYFPPNFNSDFLRNREDHFFGSYQWAFWLHIISGPPALILGLLLLSTTFRQRFPVWHRWIGRIQVANVLFLLVPSGLWMSFYAAAGHWAGLGLAVLSFLTAGTILMGFLTALRKKFAQHRIWMLRNFTLLSSAVVLRLMAGTASWFAYGPDWFDVLAVWASWLLPTLILEWSLRRKPIGKTKSHPLTISG